MVPFLWLTRQPAYVKVLSALLVFNCSDDDCVCYCGFFTEEMVPSYRNLGLAATSICNYKVGFVSWVPGEFPSDNHENCDTPFAFFRSHFVKESMEDKLPTVYVKLQGDHRSVLVVKMNNGLTSVGTHNGKLDQLSYETMIPLDTLQGYLELVCYILYDYKLSI